MSDGFNLNNLIGKAQEFQKQMQDKKSEQNHKEYESSIGGGMVKIVANGTPQITSITLEDEILKEEKTSIEEMIKLGVNGVLKQIQADSSDPKDMLSNLDMGSLLKNLNL